MNAAPSIKEKTMCKCRFVKLVDAESYRNRNKRIVWGEYTHRRYACWPIDRMVGVWSIRFCDFNRQVTMIRYPSRRYVIYRKNIRCFDKGAWNKNTLTARCVKRSMINWVVSYG